MNTPCPSLNSATQAGTRFTCPRGMEGWVDPCTCSWLHAEMVQCIRSFGNAL